ncbi:MAG: hypothetical protein EAX81_01050 [Candidatus Thorarchaeota archaeon]|nr:hypothetical protein [Candidatus Thorarchaeota archaeon]
MITSEVNDMSEKGDDFIMDEFEWALKDPTEEKLRALGEVVSIITSKLTEAISKLQQDVYDLQDKLSKVESNLGAKIISLEKGVASGGAIVSAPSPAAEADSSAAPIAQAPPPKAPSGPGGMMGELKALLAARRKKAESGE